ncbi:MAG: 50S ribosomal protein L19e [Candidatus Micrarchaeota archaeon]
MGLQTIRRLAASIFKAGESRVKIKDAARAKEALTRDDVRTLIREGVLVLEQKKGVGRAKAKFKQSRLKAGRRRGTGSLKGAKFSRASRKGRWMEKVRAQRSLLKMLKKNLKEGEYRSLYSMVKGGFFKSKKHLLTHANENKLLKGE